MMHGSPTFPHSSLLVKECNYSNKYILLLLITGGGLFRITMTVDKNIMEFEKKGLGNSEKLMDFLALGGVQTLFQ
jgi:hypothetical protein